MCANYLQRGSLAKLEALVILHTQHVPPVLYCELQHAPRAGDTQVEDVQEVFL